MATQLGAIFGAPKVPKPVAEDDKGQIDPNREFELAAAAKAKRSIFSRRGRSFLRSSGGQTRSGVSFGGSGAAPAPRRGTS